MFARLGCGVGTSPAADTLRASGAVRSRPVTFIICVSKLAQEPSDGCEMRNNAGSGFQSSCKFEKRNVTVLPNQLFNKTPMRCKFFMTGRAALNIQRNRPLLTQFALPTDTRCRRQFQSSRRRAAAKPFFNKLPKTRSELPR